MNDQLTDLEKAKVVAFCADEVMSGAVKKILLAGIYSHGVIEKGLVHNPLQNGAFSLVSLAPTNPIPNEEIGAQLRAQWAGLNALENAFNVLESVKLESETVESPYNEAI